LWLKSSIKCVVHLQGGSVAILAAMARPDYFKGVILIGPLIIPDRKAATPFKVCIVEESV